MSKRKSASLNPDTFIDEGMTLEEAERVRHADDPMAFHLSLLSEGEVMGLQLPTPTFLVRDLVLEKSITLVNGFRGHGKTWFVEALANEVTWGGKVGPWQIDTPVNTLLIDGEMPLTQIQERLHRLNIDRDIKRKPRHLFLYPESYAYRIGLKRANLLDPIWRDRISDMVLGNNIRLMVLDNLASLAPGIDENDKMQFDPINRWLLELRFHGVSIIMTHHVGKSGLQRGTTSHEDHVDLSLLLTHPPGYKNENGCKFVCEVTKDRAHATQGIEYTLELVEVDEGRMEFAMSSTSGPELAKMLFAMNPKLTEKEAVEAGVPRATYYRVKSELREG